MADVVVPMDVRMAVAFFLQSEPGVSVVEFCGVHGISRQTFYVFRRRFEAEGLEGLVPRSRRPGSNPARTGPEMVQAVVAERATLTGRGLDCGAVSIRYWLRRAGVDAPSARTIHRILVSSGLVEPQPKKRPRSSYRRFQAASPNGCWQMDGMKWPLLDGAVVTVLRVQDDHSRKIMASRAALSENTDDVWACLLAAFARHGRPAMLLTDGGSAFTMRRIHGSLGALEARLRRCGILPVVASPAHPRTCGKKEREWQTLQAWLKMRPPAKDLPGLQRQLDAYDLIFNHERPHQAHHGATPDETFAASPKARAADAALAPPMSLTRVRARLNGVIDLGGGLKTSIGTEWAYAQVTVLREDPAVAIFHDDDLIDFLHIDPSRKYQLRSSR